MARMKGDGKGQNGGGRKKGTPNRMTKEKREILSAFIDNNFDDFITAYKSIVDPEKKCRIFLELLPFAMPKLSSVELKDAVIPKTFKDELDEISGEKTRG